jgi:CheY-like chemotaxis protein
MVICNLGMPRIDGRDVGTRINAICEERSIPKTLFILLTAWTGMDLKSDRIAQSVVDAILVKRLNLKIIREVVNKLLVAAFAMGDG